MFEVMKGLVTKNKEFWGSDIVCSKREILLKKSYKLVLNDESELSMLKKESAEIFSKLVLIFK